jgi:cytochrome c oxidase subunit 1
LNAELGIKSWLLTQDHKRIAILYLIRVSFFFLVGGLLAMFIRRELLTPQADLMAPDTYNKIFTMHGIVMVFFVLIPAIPAVLGNFVLPMMLGARDTHNVPQVVPLSGTLVVAAAFRMPGTLRTSSTSWRLNSASFSGLISNEEKLK